MVQTELIREINRIRLFAGRSTVNRLRVEDDLRQDLELDSLDLAELTVRLQAKFGVDVFARRNLKTVGDVIEELAAQGPE